MTLAESLPETSGRERCPRCGIRGIPDHEEFWCPDHGPFGFVPMAWDPTGRVDLADTEAYQLTTGRTTQRHRAPAHIPKPLTEAELAAFDAYEEAMPRHRRMSRRFLRVVARLERVQRMRDRGWNPSTIAEAIGIPIERAYLDLSIIERVERLQARRGRVIGRVLR